MLLQAESIHQCPRGRQPGHEPAPGDVIPGAIIDSGGRPCGPPPFSLIAGPGGWGPRGLLEAQGGGPRGPPLLSICNPGGWAPQGPIGDIRRGTRMPTSLFKV